jgi:hypothetical protein
MTTQFLKTVVIDVRSSTISLIDDYGNARSMIVESVEDLYAKIEFIEQNKVGFDIQYINNIDTVLV